MNQLGYEPISEASAARGRRRPSIPVTASAALLQLDISVATAVPFGTGWRAPPTPNALHS